MDYPEVRLDEKKRIDSGISVAFLLLRSMSLQVSGIIAFSKFLFFVSLSNVYFYFSLCWYTPHSLFCNPVTKTHYVDYPFRSFLLCIPKFVIPPFHILWLKMFKYLHFILNISIIFVPFFFFVKLPRCLNVPVSASSCRKTWLLTTVFSSPVMKLWGIYCLYLRSSLAHLYLLIMKLSYFLISCLLLGSFLSLCFPDI